MILDLILEIYCFFIVDNNKTFFLVLGSSLGFFIGSVQASSRSFMARFIEGGNNTEVFGFFAVSGKCTAFLGPAILAIVISMYDSQKLGMSTIIIFLIIGFILMLKAPEPKKVNV